MSVRRRSNKLKRPWKHLAAVLGVASGVGLYASEALANHDAIPAAYFSLASYQPNPAPTAAKHASNLIESESLSALPNRSALYRARNFKVLDLKREMKLLNEDVVVRVKSPGRRNSFLMLELNF